ncbi:uncharacterized protein BXIN_2445 [Babesia sp. Xinjiang]|uniref:uncharacterized protein n=1 Tax=Babesia sp. Xinjiang TaxID=462227 RepID=UPI000A227514|nr:uncharacterized protein BXIN_2445 [Babesia sp. Xinjiang]ORM41520.1 hypothetical protein BXIN_2445 [Babesia sp. Xinjiang]
MTSLFKQLETLSSKSNKAYSRFRRSYAGSEHYNRVLVCESWEYIVNLDHAFLECEGLFRRCLSDVGPGAVAVMAERPLSNGDSSYPVDSDDHVTICESCWESKEIDFMVESEYVEFKRVLQLFLDLVTPWLLHEPCQSLISYLIYQYELATRFGEMLILSLLPIHESSYFLTIAELVTLPEGSEVAYYLPVNSASKHNSGDAASTQGVSRAVIIAGTVRSFSNYKQISDTAERIALVRQRGGAYVPLYAVLSVAFIEQNRGKLGDTEVRMLLNGAFSGLKHPENAAYYSAQLCILTMLFATVTVTISVQKSVVTALLDPLLSAMCEEDLPSFNLRLKLKDSLFVLLGMFNQQKYRLDILPANTTRLLLMALHKFPTLVNMFRATGGSSESLDFSRLCKVLISSVLKVRGSYCPKHMDNVPCSIQCELVDSLIDFFFHLDHSILYLRVMLYTLIDDLVIFSLSFQHGDSLIKWDAQHMSVLLNSNYEEKLSVYSMFFRKLHSISPSVFEDVLRRILQSPDLASDFLPVFMMICHSVSRGCPVHFSVLVHRCLGKPLDTDKVTLPKSVTSDNLNSTLMLYTNAKLPSKSRLELYSMISSVVDADILSSVDHNVMHEFVRVSLADHECSTLFCADRRLVTLLPPSMVADVLISHIGSLLPSSGFSFTIPVLLKMKHKSALLDMGPFYEKCFETLHRDSVLSRQLFSSLGLFCDIYSRASGSDRESMRRASHHFLSLLRQVHVNHKPLKAGKKGVNHADAAASSANADVSGAPANHGSSRRLKKSVTEPNHVSDTSPKLGDICTTYFATSDISDCLNYSSTMSLMFGILEFMVRISTATIYVNTSSGDDCVTTTDGNSLLFGSDSIWFNEWIVCYGLYESSELLRRSTNMGSATASTVSTDDMEDGHSESSPPTGDDLPQLPTILSSEEYRNLFSLTLVVLCYAIKLYRGSIMLGELTFMFARCIFKFMTFQSLMCYVPIKSEVDSSSAALGIDIEKILDRDSLLLHTMLALSSEDFTTLFKEALQMAPKAVLPNISLWLKHYFEFVRFVRSAENRPGMRLDLYGNIKSSYVEVCRSSFTVSSHGVLGDMLPSGLLMLSELLEGRIDVPELPQSVVNNYEGDISTLRIPFVSLLDLDGMMKMYSRCMDVLSYMIPELLRLKAFNNSCLMLDVMVNTLEFLVDKDPQIRRSAVSMLSRAIQSYVDTPCKAPVRLVSVCGYGLSADYSAAVAALDYPFKGFEKSLKRLCSALLSVNAPFPNVIFTNQLFGHCTSEPIVLSLLLYGCAYSGTTLQFNVDVVRRISSSISSDNSVESLSSALVGLLRVVNELDCHSQYHLNSLLRFLILFASSASCITITDLRGKHGYFASTVCPAVFDALGRLFDRMSDINESLQNDVRSIRQLCGLCISICTLACSGSAFWSLKPDIHAVFFESFDRIFGSLDVTTRRSCLKYITSGYVSTKCGVKPLAALLPRLHSCSDQLAEKLVMGIVDTAPTGLLSDIFSAILQYEKSSKGWFKMSFIVLQRFVSSGYFISEPNMSLKGVGSLLDGLLKLHKTGANSDVVNDEDVSSMSHLSHVQVFISDLYRRFVSSLEAMDIKVLRKVDTDISRCLRTLCQFYGSSMLDFIRPFLCKMCIVKHYLDSNIDIGPEGPPPDVVDSRNGSSHATKIPYSSAFSSICQLLMPIFDSDKSSSTMLRFVELCLVLSGGNIATVNRTLSKSAGGRLQDASRDKFVSELSAAYDEWLGYGIYSCITIGRLDSSSPILTRCIDLLKQSNDPVGILSKLLFTSVSSCCNEDPNIPLWIPRMDVRCLGPSKHLDIASRYESTYVIYNFIHSLLVSSPELFEVPISAECFVNFKSPGYQRYRSVSLLLQGACLSVICFKNHGDTASLSGLSKKRKGLVGICVPNSDDTATSDSYVSSIVKKALEIDDLVYTSNPRDNHPRLALGALSFFSGLDSDTVDGNYWSVTCGLDFTKQPWVCEYISAATSSLCKSSGHKIVLGKRDMVSSDNMKFSKELFTTFMRLSKVFADFLMSTGSCMVSKKLDDSISLSINRCRKVIWRTLLGLSLGLSGVYTGHCFSLARSNVEFVQQHKTLSRVSVFDFVNTVKLCIILISSYDVSSDDIDIEFVCSLARSLSKFTAYMVERHPHNINLSACLLTLMLLLRRSFGRSTGDEFLEAIMNMLVFFRCPDPLDESFNIPSEDSVLTDTVLSCACCDIFDELLQCNSDKVSKSIVSGMDTCSFTRAIPARTVTLLSFYASVSCKYYHLLRLVLSIDFTNVLNAMRDGGRLMSLVTISLHYNRIKSKYVKDLDRLYFLNANLLSDFEIASIDAAHRKARKAAKESSVSTQQSTPNNTSTPIDVMDKSPFLFEYLDKNKCYPRLELSCRLFSERDLSFGSDIGVKCFEDLAIVFAVEYFSKIKPSDVVEVLSGHIGILNRSQGTVRNIKSTPQDSTRLLLRIIVSTLKEYGNVGVTQFVLPRVYDFLNSVLNSTLDELCPVVVAPKTKTSRSSVIPRWKWFANAIFSLRAVSLSVETWDSKQASLPDMCLNTWLPTLGRALDVFDFLSDDYELESWEIAIETTFLHLVVSCSSEAERIERVLSGDLVSRSESCKRHILRILLSLWSKASFHLGSTVVNIMPVLGELADDDSPEVQRLTETLNERIQSFLNMS